MASDAKIRQYIREIVPDYDDAVKSTARFKSFSGQRSDWDPQFRFWRDLIINICRHFKFIFISPSHIRHAWFATQDGGLTPLCLPNVLLEMYKSGEVLREIDLRDPTTGQGQLSRVISRVLRFSSYSFPDVDSILNCRLVLPFLLKEKADEVVKVISETHWTDSCIVTMTKFESLFRDRSEAIAVLSYLSEQRKAIYFPNKNKGVTIEGVKLSLTSAPVPSVSSIDYHVLQLVSTVLDFQQQIHVIDGQYLRSKQSALAALRSGDKAIALRNARELKLASARREKLVSFLNKVEGVLYAVFDAQTTNKVSEAIKISAQAIKENKIDVEQVELCLQEVDELMDSQEQVNKALGTYTEDDPSLEEELHELELQMRDESLLISSSTDLSQDSVKDTEVTSTSDDLLSSAMAGLKLKNDSEELCTQGTTSPRKKLISLES